MIKSITVNNYLGEGITLELMNPEKSGFVISRINGLQPAKSVINTSDIATQDGSLFNSSKITSRNIVLELKYLPNPTIETTRQQSYRFFPVKREVELIIDTDNRYVSIKGYVESNEINIFSKEEGSTISIICPDPYFYSTGPNGTVLTSFSNTEPRFHFPFSNNSTTKKLLEFGDVINLRENTVKYTGDAEAGIEMEIYAIGNVENITIYNVKTREHISIDTQKLKNLTGNSIISGDTIIISTSKGNKKITLLRDGVYINVLNAIGKDSSWFTLAKGDNLFTYTAESGVENLKFLIRNRIMYEGV